MGIIKNSDFDKYVDFLESGVFLSVFMENIAVVCKVPNFLNKDQNGKMHCTTDYAIAWEDGYGQHYVHGVFFDKELFEKFFKSKATPQEIMEMRNQDQKAAVIEHYGLDYVLPMFEPRLIDSYDGISKVTYKPIHYELYRVQTPAGERNMLVAEDHSKHTKHPLLIPIKSDIDNQEIVRWSQAAAWTFEMNEGEYLDCIKEGES